MSTDTEREAFEAWALTHHKMTNPGPLHRVRGEYFYWPVNASWSAWQARAAIAQQAEPVQECADNDSPWLVCKPCVAAGKCKQADAQQAEPCSFPPQVPNEHGHLLTTEALWRMYVEDAPTAAQAEPVQHVKIPTNAEEAEAMLRVSTLWMQQNAPEVLRALLRAPMPVQADAQPVAPRDREADRARFPDPAFNLWLDEGISDAGHTVWDAVGDVQAAWSGWDNRQHYAAPTARQPLTDEQLREAFRTSADNLTLRAHWQGLKAFARAIERAHGITAQRTQEGEKP